MKILLKKNIDKVGKRGEIVEVSDGYARNYLFPKKFALKPTPQNIKQLEVEKRRYVQQETDEKKQMAAIAERLKEISCTIVARADQDSHLYGSITESMIVSALAEQNIKIEARCIQMEQHIKELGVFNIAVHLHPEIESQVRVWVVEETEEGTTERPAAEAAEPKKDE